MKTALKILKITSIAAMLASLAACGGGGETPTPTPTPTPTSSSEWGTMSWDQDDWD